MTHRDTSNGSKERVGREGLRTREHHKSVRAKPPETGCSEPSSELTSSMQGTGSTVNPNKLDLVTPEEDAD